MLAGYYAPAFPKHQKTIKAEQRDFAPTEYRLVEQAEQRGFKKGVIQHALNTKWSDFADKGFILT